MSDLNALRQEFWTASPEALFPRNTSPPYATVASRSSNASAGLASVRDT